VRPDLWTDDSDGGGEKSAEWLAVVDTKQERRVDARENGEFRQICMFCKREKREKEVLTFAHWQL
jgi:hypothetical protein